MDRGAFLTVGIGASAGGIQAMRRFFQHVPSDSGIAYVVVLHLSPQFESHLAEVLQTSASIPVSQVVDRVEVAPNHVYVVPPNRSLSMGDGHLAVSPVASFEERRAPVDVFFRTLAISCGPRAAAVVLSGTGANGSMGMRRVKEEGGICLAQDPDEAEYSDMPRNAIARAHVDHVLPVADIPAKIIAYGRSLDSIRLSHTEPVHPPTGEEAALADIFGHLRRLTGHDFSNYKRATMLRRLVRRMSLLAITDFAEYGRWLKDHPDEAQLLLQDLLISVTNFFRDREAFETLRRDVLPGLCARKAEGDQIRAWVVGCATGEEAYSIAMLLAEQAWSCPDWPTVQVFATDIDERAIETAREGVYTLNDAADVSPERLQRFFINEGGTYRIRKELREMVLFARHNVLRDPPFSHLDLVACRNLLIYLNPRAQDRVMQVIRFALNPGGYLLLGSSESVEEFRDLFQPIDKEARIFQARAVGGRSGLPVLEGPDVRAGARLVEAPRETQPSMRHRLSIEELHLRLLEEYAPPSVVVDEEHEILHLSSGAARYLKFGAGKPTHNLIKAINPELRLELQAALYQAAQEGRPVEAPGLAITGDDETRRVNLTVRPVLRQDDPAGGFFLVLFQEAEAASEPAQAEPVSRLSGNDVSRQLEQEMSRLRGQLKSSIERHETQAEELKASNEELQAMNEELRSSAEELETSKEELQSVNEELRTVNQQLTVKVNEISQSNDDLRNLMGATDVGTIFLDRSLRVQLFTPRAQDCFSLRPGDIGRPLGDITSKLSYQGMLDDAQLVIEDLRTIEREVESSDGAYFLARLLPYRTVEDRIGGVILTFVEITRRRSAELELKRAHDQLAVDVEAMTRLQELSTRLLSAGSLAELLDEMLTAVISLQGADFGNVQLYDMASGSPEIVAQRGFTEEFLAHFARVSDATSACGRAMSSRQRVVIEDVEDDPAYEPHRQAAASAGYRAVQSTPMLGPNGELLGIFSTHFRQPHRPSARELRLTDLYAAQASRLIAGKREEEAVRSAEERLRLIVESVPAYAIFSIGTDGSIETWNAAAERVFGYRPEDVVGRSFAMLFTEDDRARGVPDEEMRRARDEGRAIDERWHTTSGGARFFASGVLAPLRTAAGTLTGYVKIARDLTDRKRWEEALRLAHADLENRVLERTAELAAANQALDAELTERRQAEEQVRALLGRLITAQEDERRVIALDLHDHLGQQVAGLSLKIDALKEIAHRNRALRTAVEDIQQTIGRLDRDLDFFIWQMRPPDIRANGLAASLRRFVAQWSENFGIQAEFHSGGLEGQQLAYDVETSIYRITQEALNNVHKHARANRVGVILERRGARLALIVEDDGVGFDPSSADRVDGNDRGVGVSGMKERAAMVRGTLEIETGLKKGTTVFLQVPVSEPGQ